MPNEYDDYGRAHDTSNKYVSDAERREFHGHRSDNVGFKLEEISYGTLLIGKITSGEFEGASLSIRVDKSVINEILTRPEIAPHVESYRDVPVAGAHVNGQFQPGGLPPDGKLVLALAREVIAPQDGSKSVTEAIKGLPEINMSQIQLDMDVIPGMKLERGKLVADLTGDFGFKDAAPEAPAQKLGASGFAAKPMAMKPR